MIKSINLVYALLRPSERTRTLPLVIDSPHGGTIYPFNSGIVAPRAAAGRGCGAAGLTTTP